MSESKKKTRTLSKSFTKRVKNINKEKKILSDINIMDIYNEFIKLFNFISKSEIKSINYSININNSEKKTNYKNPYASYYDSFNNNNNSNKNKFKKQSTLNGNKNDILNILIKNQINKKTIQNLKIQNYNKFHDINLAREKTIEKIKEDKIYNDNLILEKKY